MFETNSKFYSLLTIVCLIGYLWIFYVFNSPTYPKLQTNLATVCIFKNVSTFPCPSCGSTRAIVLLVKGHLLESLYLNPLGILASLIMVICPVWVSIDFLYSKKSLFDFYTLTKKFIEKKPISIILLTLIFLNWIWNISKNL